jgi:formylglycine-generating enzyme required for sulfatase activity
MRCQRCGIPLPKKEGLCDMCSNLFEWAQDIHFVPYGYEERRGIKKSRKEERIEHE